MLEKMQRNCIAQTLLMRTEHDTATLENDLAISYKIHMQLPHSPELHSQAFVPEK